MLKPSTAVVSMEIIRVYLTPNEQRMVDSTLCRWLKQQYEAERLYVSPLTEIILPRHSPQDLGDKLPPGVKIPPSEPIGEPVEKEPKPEAGWVLNTKAIEILNQALELGCLWAKEEITKVSAKYPPNPPNTVT